MPYPMARGEERRIKRREAILVVVVILEEYREEDREEDGCDDVIIRLSGASYGEGVVLPILFFWVPTTL